jgi:signal transduction histidine kinase
MTVDEIIYTNFFDYVNQSCREEARAYLERAREDNNDKALTLTINRPDGEQREVLWSAQWAQQEGRDLQGRDGPSKDDVLISIFHDVSDERAAERLKQRSWYGHPRLRTPLTTVQNYLQFLGEESMATQASKPAFLPGAQRSSDRMMRLIGDLLDIEIKSGMMELNRESISAKDI